MHRSLILTSLAITASAACDRAFLRSATNDYIVAQSAGQPSGVHAFTSPDVSYTENNKILDIMTGILSKPINMSYTRAWSSARTTLRI